ncbi:hypothetical protein CHU00_02950 [Sphingobacterium cellulitidis]|nr:hypothetical protein CHU00_02950 [Sphingobacterium cellulitidis]
MLDVLESDDMFIIGQCNVHQWTGCQGFEEGPRSCGMRNFPQTNQSGDMGFDNAKRNTYRKNETFCTGVSHTPFCNNMAYVILLSKAGKWGLIKQGENTYRKNETFCTGELHTPFFNNMVYVILLSLMVCYYP